MFTSFGRSGKVWAAFALSLSLVAASAVVARAAVSGKHHHNGREPIICRRDGRRTVESHGVYYIVRNDVIRRSDHECIKLVRKGPGFVVVRTEAHSQGSGNDAFPEVFYGCAWGLCTKNTVLPRRLGRLQNLVTSWDATWRRAQGKFNVAYDLWFGYRYTIHGHALGAELMIWLGSKAFPTPLSATVVRIDGIRWYFVYYPVCTRYGCWKYIQFRRVMPSTHAHHLRLLPFFRYATRQHLLHRRWFLKSIDVGFEIWQNGLGLAVHRYSLLIKLHPLPEKHTRVRK